MKAFCLTLLLAPGIVGLSAQSAPHASEDARAASGQMRAENGITLHARATAVVVDVVVVDRDHRPVHGLKRGDFAVAEDKKPQTIASFEEHISQPRMIPTPKMPPGVFTNFTFAPVNSAVNVLLIDMLNTPLEDQTYLKAQILKFVNSPNPPHNIAIFGLGLKLRMLQGFSSDPDILKAVVNKQFGKASPLLADQVGGSGVQDSISDVMSEPAQSLMPPDVVAAMQTLEDMNKSLTAEIRAQDTLAGLNELARYLASIPGRKNLIWFSGSFPVNILASAIGTGANDRFASVADVEAEYKTTSALLSKAQVAVYPIDARGMQSSPVFTASSAGSRYAGGNPKNVTKDELSFFSDQASEHGTMARMAEDTGGRAFYNTNDLAGAVMESIQDGANYYTLSYSPSNSKQDGEFRKIEVKLAASGYSLEYRRGYFADKAEQPRKLVNAAPEATPTATVTTAQKAMLHGVPPATQLLYKVLIQPAAGGVEETLAKGNIANKPGYAPAKPPYRRYVVAFAASPQDLTFTVDKAGMHETNVNFVTLVYSADGLLVNTQNDNIKARFNAADYETLMHGGLRFSQEISVPDKGDYSIRTGVYDTASDKLGSLETSVAALKNLPAVALPQ